MRDCKTQMWGEGSSKLRGREDLAEIEVYRANGASEASMKQSRMK